jgi:GNAT superfamily N-acetyltransferase
VTEAYLIRALTPADEPVLWEMLYQAIYVGKGETPPAREIVQRPELAQYVQGWGRPHDLGFAAVDETSQAVIAAAWQRLWRGDERGFGYVNEETPELSVAVLPEHRGRGIGTALVTRLLDAARTRYGVVSLSVAEENPALRLYERLGFKVVGRSGTSLTMKKGLEQREGLVGVSRPFSLSHTPQEQHKDTCHNSNIRKIEYAGSKRADAESYEISN